MEPTTQTNPAPSKISKGKLLTLVFAAFLAVLIALVLTRSDGAEEALESVNQAPPAVVSITEEGFSPSTIKIQKDQRVTWTNNGTGPHQIASDPHPTHDDISNLFSQEPLKVNDSYTFVFTESGTFTYHDELNPVKSRGTVVVE